ncbi:hypothetical protein Poly41_27750 [Novipirellula artificiosorum]|uniref:Uncharacterized protein n=1 Tax=Novipirellula artificiosorum TaxID=2528016 RepID=A0A5C6DU43_9BACT|nr:hypothetical protein Poly41_27750 [Novipirellula artificiosorum]
MNTTMMFGGRSAARRVPEKTSVANAAKHGMKSRQKEVFHCVR